jgi:ApbE superfamily uncharacterized protein (UPF0280 family)
MRLLKRRTHHFDVPVQDMLLRVSGPEELYEEARAAGMQFWEQVQAYAIRHPGFQSAKRPLSVPEDAPEIVRQMAAQAGLAGVGPMFTFRGALTEYVGRRLASTLSEVIVSCGSDHYVASNKRARLGLRGGGSQGMALVIKPELGPQGIFSSLDPLQRDPELAEGLVVVARSCILADAAAAAATAILTKPDSFRPALGYLRKLPGVHGALLIRGEHIGVAGALELAA